jgi:radical SAM protein with 4Fe4S-binding SPASM domain
MHPSACGFLFCYNEEQILRESLLHYLNEGVDLVVVDNQSSDGSMEIVDSLRDDGIPRPGRIRDVIQVKTEGYEWRKILSEACRYMHLRLSSYDWILLIDADSFYRSPVRGLSLLEFLDVMGQRGYNILEGKLCEFYPTDRDNASIVSPLDRLRYCEIHQPYPQEKIFRYHPGVDFYSHFGHVCLREDRRVGCVPFLYLHYKWVSYEHGARKLFKDRMPRFVERRQHSRFHPQYLGLLPLESDLIKRADSLTLFREEEMSLSKEQFDTRMRFHQVLDWAGAVSRPMRRARFRAARRWKSLRTVFHWSPRMALDMTLKLRQPKPAESTAGAGSARFYGKPLARSDFWVIRTSEWVQQKPYADGLPQNYHFLMTDFCNASCIFCNQDFASTRQISLADFQQMTAHIPATRGANFFLSGGGEPLLCRSIFPIIHYINEELPWVPITIKSNGLLVGKFAEEIAQCRIQRFGMSVHGATRETNNAVLRPRNERSDVFESIGELNEELHRRKRRMWKIFYMVVSRVNVGEVPDLVRKAAELEVNEVMVMFSKVFPPGIYENQPAPPAKPEDSLFFHPQLYNSAIRQSKKLARSLGVTLRHEPLFGEKFKPQPCFIPWHTVVVNWDGEIYPCTGGEVWFRKPVRSAEYRFGNLLEQHLADFWNNESWVKIRRTNNRHTAESFVPECSNCHNTCCFRGPDVKEAHILEFNSSANSGALHVIGCGGLR